MSDTASTEDPRTHHDGAVAVTEPGATDPVESQAVSDTVDDVDEADTPDTPRETDTADAPDEGANAVDAVHAPDAVAVEGESGAPAKPEKGSRVRQLEREGEVAADFLETLLDIADLDGDLDVDVDGDRAAVAIVDSEEGRVPRRLVGPDGKVLEALQELTRLAVQVETGERSRLMLDIAGHRAQRRETLVELARVAIEDVKATGARKSLEPMSAFERKVVHDEVAAAGLESESEGVDPKRHVVILPA